MIRLIFRTVRLVTLLFAAAAFSQSRKAKALPISDFDKWSTLLSLELSEDGSWTSYASAYEDGDDTLFVKNNLTAEKHQFPGGRNGHFISRERFACTLQDMTLSITHLPTGAVSLVPDVEVFYPLDGGSLLLTQKAGGDGNEIGMTDGLGNVLWKKANVNDFALAGDGSSIAYSVWDGQKSQVFISPIAFQLRERLVAEIANSSDIDHPIPV